MHLSKKKESKEDGKRKSKPQCYKYCLVLKTILALTILQFPTEGFSQENANLLGTAFNSLNVYSNARICGGTYAGVVSIDQDYEGSLGINPALLASSKHRYGMQLSYMPWLRSVSPSTKAFELAYFHKINRKSFIGFNSSALLLGNHTIIDQDGFIIGSFRPIEHINQLSYSRKISNRWNIGISAKHLMSKLPLNDSTYEIKKVHSYAFDLGVSYRNRVSFNYFFQLKYNIGASISNLGPRVSIDEDSNDLFIPTTLHLGALLNPEIYIPTIGSFDFSFAYEGRKLLIPTPPLLDENSQIIAGMDPDISIFKALHQSFYDAPNGISEEISEITHIFCFEERFNLNKHTYIAYRQGRFTEHKDKGNRNYKSKGFSLSYKGMNASIFYVSRKSLSENLHKTWGLTLGYKSRLP